MLVPPPDTLDRHRRIAVVGVTGSGKSHLARRIAEVAGLPYVDVDALMWLPGWVQRPHAEQVAVIRPVLEGDAWVLDSFWSSTRALVLDRADLLVALDYPRRVSLWRLVRRTAVRLVTKEPICGENVESWRMLLSRESILLWHLQSFAERRMTIAALARDPAAPPVVRFAHPREAERWLHRLGAGRAA